ncbi:MAG: hypothetical protein AB1782_10990 [Cyanobacteriota bacterium]
MLYTDALSRQIDECTSKIYGLKQKIASNKDPNKRKLILLEIENAKIHMTSLNKLIIMFNNTITAN